MIANENNENEIEKNGDSLTPEYPECAADAPIPTEEIKQKRIPPKREMNDNEVPIMAVYAGPVAPPADMLHPVQPSMMLVYAGPGMMNGGINPFATNPNPRVPNDSTGTVKTVFCPACGAKIPANAKFCMECGTSMIKKC